MSGIGEPRDGRLVRLGDGLLAQGVEVEELDGSNCRKIESWLAALLQAEHLSLLIGNGLSMGVGYLAGKPPPSMASALPSASYETEIETFAVASASQMGRTANVEDRIRAALALIDGLKILGDSTAEADVQNAVDGALASLISGVLDFERNLRDEQAARNMGATSAVFLLQRFLLPFASRASGRDRLSLFTTNYDRLLEYGAELLGLRLVDRFVGSLRPRFSPSRLDIDMHYSPPGVRGEPRYLEGVVRYSKLHGSVDWRATDGVIVRDGLPFGADLSHPSVPSKPSAATMIYPNPAKDIETLAYPYAELFRDFASAICRPNAVLVTYGYGFGDSHINRAIASMLELPSTHLVVISRDPLAGLDLFRTGVHYPPSQTTELIGPQLGDLSNVVEFLPSLASQSLLEAQISYAERSRAVDSIGATKGAAEGTDNPKPTAQGSK